MSATEIASLYGLLTLKDEMSDSLDAAEKKAQGFGDRLKSMSDSVTTLGVSLSAMAAPIVGGMGVAVNSALAFDESMTNVQSVLGATDDEMAIMGASVLELGANSRQGGQAAAEAMYDIAGGVADASTHMDILATSLDVADASSANLNGVVNAMVKTMNIFGLSAEDAAHAGDVFTRTVGMGVGTADEFASALPPVEGLAKELGLTFDDVGGMMAYMSTQSASVAEGGTQLRGVFSKLINPSADLNKAIKAMGYESGKALVEQEGLVGALNKIKEFGGGSFEGLITDQEALLGAIALTGEGAEDFFTTFEDGIDGATDAAKAIQMDSPAAQIDLLMNSLSALGITVGQTLLPVLTDIIGVVRPIISSIMEWVTANPELVQQIATVGAVVGGMGAALTGLGLVLGIVGGAFTALTSPIGIALTAGAALVAAYTTNFGGLKDFIDTQVRPKIEDFFNFLGDIWAKVSPALTSLKDWFVTDGFPKIKTEIENIWNNVITPFVNFLADVWTNTLQPGLQPIVDWFTSGEAWKTITGAVDEVKLAVETVFNWFAGVWETTLKPALQPIVDWFTSGEAWQTITTAVDTVKGAVETAFNWFSTVWATIIQPGLQPFVDWFTSGEAWQTITTAVDTVKGAVETAFTWFSTVWETLIKPGLQPFVDWFTSGEAWKTITTAVDEVKLAAETVFNWFAGIWTNTLQPGLQPIIDWFTGGTGWKEITTAVNDVKTTFENVVNTIKTKIDEFVKTVSGIWESVKTGVQALADGINTVLGPIADVVQGLSDAFSDLTGQTQVTVSAGGTVNAAGLADYVGSRDGGGQGVAGQPVVIGTGAQPELFIPQTAGTFVPAHQQGAGGPMIGTVIIQAETEAGGAAAAVGFERKIQELREGRG